MSIKENPPTFIEKLKDLGIKNSYDAASHCLIQVLKDSGKRGLTMGEIMESFGLTKKIISENPGLLEHGISFVRGDLKNWKNSAMVKMVGSRIFNNKVYYFLKQGFDLDIEIFTLICNSTLKNHKKMNGKSIPRTKQVHDGTTSIIIKTIF